MIKQILANNKRKLAVIMSLVLLITVASIALGVNAAERVEIESVSNPELEFVTIHGKNSTTDVWEPKGSYKEPSAGKYIINTNAYAQWWDADSLHFAYKKFKFNYGKTGMLTAITQLDSWTGEKNEAGAGLLLRSSLDPSAATLMLHCRPGTIMITYRAGDKQDSIKGKEVKLQGYPVKFKAELISNKITCYYMYDNGKTWVKLGSFPFINTNPDVYVGVSAYSQDEAFTATAQFTGLDVKIEADEGYVSGGSGDTGESEPDKEEEIKLPEDFPVPENVLLSETFTDGSLKNTPESATNWIWKYYDLDAPEIVTNSDNTNRYLYDWNAENRYYYAGNQHWTDYETSLDLTFTGDYSLDSENGVYLYVRHTNIVQYGFYDYVVYLKSVKGQQSINLGIRQHEGSITTAPSNLASVPYKYLPEVGEDDVSFTLRVKTFDNKLSVYINDSEEPIINAEFEGKYVKIDGVDQPVETGEASVLNTEGNIGFMTNNAAVKIDNIRVTKIEDPDGGDYDNRIGGNWNTSIDTPDHYLSEYIENGWKY